MLLPGRSLCGDLRLAQIGIGEDVLAGLAPKTFANTPELWRDLLPPLQAEGHKYARGHALVVSGPAFHTGAARLAALAAARIGAGLVTIAGPSDALAQHAAQVTSIMLAPCADASALAQVLADARKNAVVIGPGLGLGPEARAMVEVALSPAPGRALVLDAEALTAFAGQAGALKTLVHAHGGPVVLTPHEGEFARLSKGLNRELESVSQPLDPIFSSSGFKTRTGAQAGQRDRRRRAPEGLRHGGGHARWPSVHRRGSAATTCECRLGRRSVGDDRWASGARHAAFRGGERGGLAAWPGGRASRPGPHGGRSAARRVAGRSRNPTLKRKKAAGLHQRPKSREETPKEGWVGASARP